MKYDRRCMRSRTITNFPLTRRCGASEKSPPRRLPLIERYLLLLGKTKYFKFTDNK